MSIADQITRLQNAKANIKTSIENKGVAVSDEATLDSYPALIDSIEVGSGGGEAHINPDFYEKRTIGGTNYEYLFYGYNGPDIDVSNWDTSKVTSAQFCFANCKKSMDISKWDLSSLTNAYCMFQSYTNNNTYLDLSALDFSKVSDVRYMFAQSNIDYLDVRNINLTGATNYERLFDSCNGTELDLSSWDISNVTNLTYTFSGSHTKIDLTGWKTTNVKTFNNTFYNYSSKLTHLIIPDWDMTNATSTTNFIYTSRSVLKYVDLSRSNDTTISKITTMLPTYTATTYGEIVIPADTSQEVIDAILAKYWKPVGPKYDLVSTELVFDLDEIKPGKTTKLYTGNNNPWYGDDRLETIEFISSDESIATVNGREITGVSEGTVIISARNKETQAILGTATLTVSETDSNPNLIKFKTTGGESNTTTLIVVNGKGLTRNTMTYDNISNVYSYDPGTQITSIKFIYSSSYPYTNEIIKFDFNAANITDMEKMFECYQGTTLDLSDWDTSNVTNMDCIFTGCKSLQTIIGELDLSNIKTGGNDHFSTAFLSCYNLESLYLKNIFKNSAMINASTWCIDLGQTKVKDESLIYIINELPDLINDKGLTATDKIILTLPPTNTLTAEQVQPAIDKGWSVANCNF